MRTLTGGTLPKALVMVAMGLTVTSAATELAAQGIPDEYTNLEILPQDISRQEIVSIMRGYAGAVGGSCSTCHMVSEQLNQPTDDFASDEKATKRRARIMMEMVRRINTTTLASLPDRREPNVDVTCNTCHGGIARPQPIDDVMASMLEEEGIDAAIQRYRQLSTTYAGARAYDFSFRPLNRLAERLGRARVVDVIRFLELNAEFNPTSLPR